jgi:hypothetical protein
MPSHSPVTPGGLKASRLGSRMSTSAAARRSSWTLFRPATGQVRAQSVTNSPNVVLHPWLHKELLHVPRVPLPPLRLICYLGRPGLTGEYLDGDVVVRSRGDAGLHTAVRILVEHGRVRRAHPVHSGTQRPAPSERCGDQQLVGRHSGRLERSSNSVRVGWQTLTTPPPSETTSST